MKLKLFFLINLMAISQLSAMDEDLTSSTTTLTTTVTAPVVSSTRKTTSAERMINLMSSQDVTPEEKATVTVVAEDFDAVRAVLNCSTSLSTCTVSSSTTPSTLSMTYVTDEDKKFMQNIGLKKESSLATLKKMFKEQGKQLTDYISEY